MENSLIKQEKAIRFCIECGSEMEEFYCHHMIMKTSVAKNVRLAIIKVIVIVAVNNLYNILYCKYNS